MTEFWLEKGKIALWQKNGFCLAKQSAMFDSSHEKIFTAHSAVFVQTASSLPLGSLK